MSFIYQNVTIGNKLDVKNTGKVITSTKGDLITDDGMHSIRLAVGLNGQALVADSTQTSGLTWKTLNATDIGLNAGNGLVLTDNTLNVGGSPTIISNNDNLEVNSSAISGQVLQSTGTVGNAATYGAISLNNTNSITGTLPISNGGTGSNTFATGNRLLSTNAGKTAFIETSLNPSTVVTTTGSQTLDNKTLNTPIITGSINDSNGNELLTFNPTTDAVNQISIQNSATSTGPIISATGNDDNIDLNINAKGDGNVNISSIEYPNTDGTAGQVLATNGAGQLSFVDVEISKIGTVTTTDATLTTIPALTITSTDTENTLYHIEAKFVARETIPNVQNVATFIVRSTLHNNTGTLTKIGTDLVYVSSQSETTWTADINASGLDIIFQVRGETTSTILWKASITVLTV